MTRFFDSGVSSEKRALLGAKNHPPSVGPNVWDWVDPLGLSKGTNPFKSDDPLVQALKRAIPKGAESDEYKNAMKAIRERLDNPQIKKGQRSILRAALKVGKAPAKYAAKYGIRFLGAVFAVALNFVFVDNLNADEMSDHAMWVIDQEIEKRNEQEGKCECE